MIPRYSSSDMEQIWSDQHRFDLWLMIEKLVVQYLALNGNIPPKDAEAILDKASFTIDKVLAKEQETKHELAAFVDVLAEAVGPEGRWIHYGLTSSDIMDTALSLQMIEVVEIIIRDLKNVWKTLRDIKLSGSSSMVGRTHGMHAEVTTFADKRCVWLDRINRDLKRCERLIMLKENMSIGTLRVGKLSGTVGNYSTIEHYIEEDIFGEQLNFYSTNATQVIERDIHAEFVWALANVATTLDSIATDLRILSMSEIGEVSEKFNENQKGSSAMPHKKNPVRLERITGLARLARSYVSTALENSVLWNERDMSHSSVERIMFPDLSHLVHFMIKEMNDILSNLQINEKKMRDNIFASKGVTESHKIMLGLIDRGYSRQEAYQKIQELSFKALNENKSFYEICKESKLFDENYLFHNFDVVFSIYGEIE